MASGASSASTPSEAELEAEPEPEPAPLKKRRRLIHWRLAGICPFYRRWECEPMWEPEDEPQPPRIPFFELDGIVPSGTVLIPPPVAPEVLEAREREAAAFNQMLLDLLES